MAYRNCPHNSGVICDGKDICERCGWERKEAARRMHIVQNESPSVNWKGQKYFPLKKKSRPSGANAESGKAK